MSVTSRSPMKIAPASTSSSPASIRSAVVLPEPDGPTSTMNSPSSTWRSSASTAGTSVLGYMRDACSKRTSANTGLQEFTARAFVRLGTRAQLVEGEQGGAGDRWRRRGMDGEGRAELAQSGLDRAEEVPVPR